MHSTLEKIIREEQIDFVQFNYSIRVRNAERSLLKRSMDQGVAVIVNEPLEKGSLFELVRGKNLPPWAREYGITSWCSFFLKYILSNPAVNCVIPGTSDRQHMLDIISSGNEPLPDDNCRQKMIHFLDSLK
jgi:predicted aldo/keto reductase-like oxidoreductase